MTNYSFDEGRRVLIINDVEVLLTEGVLLFLESACARARYLRHTDKWSSGIHKEEVFPCIGS